MTLSDSLYYIVLGNPVSKTIVGTTSSVVSRIAGTNGPTTLKPSAMTSKAMKAMMPPLWKLAGHNYNFIRLAGLSGASAVILGAIGSHTIHTVQDKHEARTIFDTANRFHFFHSIALLGLPLARRPLLSGFLMITGTAFFSGTLYYRAFTGEKRFARLAPLGGTLLILAWLSLMV